MKGKCTRWNTPGWHNNGKPRNQVATKSLPSHEIFGRNPAILKIDMNFIYKMNASEQTTNMHPLKALFKVKNKHFLTLKVS